MEGETPPRSIAKRGTPHRNARTKESTNISEGNLTTLSLNQDIFPSKSSVKVGKISSGISTSIMNPTESTTILDADTNRMGR